MAKADQKMRKSAKSSLEEIKKQDSLYTSRLRNIVHDIGWPMISKVGVIGLESLEEQLSRNTKVFLRYIKNKLPPKP